MKIEIKKVVRDLSLGEYASEYEGLTVKVWVNPDRGTVAERDNLQVEFNRQMTDASTNAALLDAMQAWVADVYLPAIFAWYARIWSQGEESTHWTIEELKALDERDPALYDWMKKRSFQMIVEHRNREKKD